MAARAVQVWRARLAERRTRKAASKLYEGIVALAAADPWTSARGGPLVSLICPTYNTKPAYLDALISSLRSQTAGIAELILSDDGSTNSETLRWLDGHASDADLIIVRNATNRGIAVTTNAGLERARSPWVGFIDHDDALAPFALDRIAKALSEAPGAQFLFTDEAICDARMRVLDLFLKPAFDPVLLSGVNYVNHLSLYRRERLQALGGLAEGYDGSQDYELLLRYTCDLRADEILHLPYPAYLWRRDGMSYSVTALDAATRNARRAIARVYQLPQGEAQIDDALGGSLHRIRFDREPRPWPKVSVVIPNRDAYALISSVLKGLAETDYPDLEILVVDNGSTDPRVLELYRNLTEKGGFHAYLEPETFNFARAVNKGFARADGRYLMMLNNDIEIISRGWLKEMVSCFDYPDVGVVGVKLLYPDRTIQHAGVIVGFGTIAGHWHLNEQENFPGPMGRFWVRQSLSAVTGACLMISREVLDRIGPLDETRFAIAYNDIDLCLRAVKAGWKVVWTPFATCIHHESASRGSDETPANLARFRREQQNLIARHQTPDYDDFAISPWYTKDRSIPTYHLLNKLPGARPGAGARA